MMSIRIRVSENPHTSRPGRLAYAEWSGEIDWPTVPRPGVDHWVHCGDWSAEEINRSFFYGPAVISESVRELLPGVTIEVETEAEVIAHLIADHGFTGGNE